MVENIINNLVKMCVIDDMEIVVEGVTTQIDWAKYRIVICGTAYNGEDGKRIIEQHKPELIISDIRMPKLDGIELAHYVKENFPNSRLLLITGYTDFHYAQLAIRLGVADMITKPFSLEEIVEAVIKERNIIEENRSQELQLHTLKQQSLQGKRMQRQQILDLIVKNPLEKSNITSYWDELDLTMSSKQVVVGSLQIDSLIEEVTELSVKELELQELTLYNIVEETISFFTQGVIFKDTLGRYVLLFNTTEVYTNYEIVEQICRNIATYSNFTVSIGLSSTMEGIYHLHEGYKQAVLALSYQFYSGGNAISEHSRIPRQVTGSKIIFELEKKLIATLECGNRIEALSILDQYLLSLVSEHSLPSPEQIKFYCNQIAFLMLRTFQNVLGEEEFQSIPSYFKDDFVMKTSSYENLKKQLSELCDLGCNLLLKRNQSVTNSAIEDAIRFIDANLHLDIMVADCARKVHLSPSYFSAIFKKKMGCTYNTYLNRCRMERAKQLILADHPIQNVAVEVGYVERRYFTSVFKKYTGLTPSEFKQQHWQDEYYESRDTR